MICTKAMTHKLNAWGRNKRNMGYCSAPLVMPDISGTRKKIQTKHTKHLHGHIPGFLLPLE